MNQDRSLRLERLEAFGGLDVHEWRHVDFSFSPHCHDEWVLAVYLEGHKAYRCHGERGVLAAGDVLLIAPGTVHSAHTVEASGWRYLSVSFDLEQAEAATGMTTSEIQRRVGSHREVPAGAGGTSRGLGLEELAASPEDGAGELALAELFLAVVDADSSRDLEIGAPSRLGSVRDWLRDEPERPFTLHELSALAEVSPEHLSRSFKAEFGLAPFQLLAASRTDRARALIRGGSPLADAALDAGFADQSHMARWFRRIYGVPPGRFKPPATSNPF